MTHKTQSNFMKKYFYSNNQEKEGPVSLEELLQLNLNPKTLIWYEGLEDWRTAESIDEMKHLFELIPPPITPEIKDKIASELKTSKREKQSMFSNPFSFDGRIRRMEYGISFIITCFIFTIVKGFVQTGDYPLAALAYIPIYWFFFAQGAKRCHDYGNSGWWQIIPLYPIYMLFKNGQIELNEYGYNPKNSI
jgi:hypothetical protein